MIDPASRWRRMRPHYLGKDGLLLSKLIMCHYQTHNFKGIKGKRERVLPMDYDCCDWRCNGHHRAWHQMVCTYACYWTAPIHLRVLQRCWAKEDWRIVKGQQHAACWSPTGWFDPQRWALNRGRQEWWAMGRTREYADLSEYVSSTFIHLGWADHSDITTYEEES